ncbi:MAG: hypothetical protein ACQET7_03415 [Thermodesulfobacteriota bacterium]
MSGYFDVDLVAIILAYLIAWHGDSWAGIFALGTGLLTDVLSAAPLGLFSVIHLILFLGIRIGDAVLDVQSIKGQLIVVFLAVFLRKLMFIGLLNLFSLRAFLDAQILFALFCSAVFTAVAAPAVFLGFDTVGTVLRFLRSDSKEPQP